MISKVTKGITKAVFAIIIIVIIVIAGVGVYYYYTSTTKPTTPVTPGLSGTINVAAVAGFGDATLRQLATNFEAIHPGVTVNIISIPYASLLTDYTTAFQANKSVYDVMMIGSVGFLGVLSPYLLDLTPYINNPQYFGSQSYNWSDIVPSLLTLYQANGNQYGIPIKEDGMMLYYRPSLFDNLTNQAAFQQQFGYPMPNPATTTLTWQQVADLASFFNGKHGSKYGIAVMSDSNPDDIAQIYMSILAGLRQDATSTYGPITGPYGVLFSSNGTPIINSSIGQEAFNIYDQLIANSESPLVASYSSVPSYFAAGGTAMMLMWTAPALTLSNSTTSNVVGDWAIAPRLPGGYTILGGTGMAIWRYTSNLPLALAFLTYATSPTGADTWNQVNGFIPFRYSEFTYAIQHNPSEALIFSNISSVTTYGVQGSANLISWEQISHAFIAELPSIYNGHVSVQQGSNIIESEVESYLS